MLSSKVLQRGVKSGTLWSDKTFFSLGLPACWGLEEESFWCALVSAGFMPNDHRSRCGGVRRACSLHTLRKTTFPPSTSRIVGDLANASALLGLPTTQIRLALLHIAAAALLPSAPSHLIVPSYLTPTSPPSPTLQTPSRSPLTLKAHSFPSPSSPPSTHPAPVSSPPAASFPTDPAASSSLSRTPDRPLSLN